MDNCIVVGCNEKARIPGNKMLYLAITCTKDIRVQFNIKIGVGDTTIEEQT